jgi:hypothetical protein
MSLTVAPFQESHVTLHVMVPWREHRALLSNRGRKIEVIIRKHNVQIKFPDRHMRGMGMS